MPANAPDAGTRDALLARGYALAGSSYDPAGSWWALNTAVDDQFATIDAVTASGLPHEPDRVLAFGTSMGGLVSALEAERGAGIIDGALSTCGIVAGAVHLNNYQLDAEYAIAKLLMPAPGPKLVDFANPGEGAASGAALTAAVEAAQTTPEGRARVSLVFALLNVAPSAPGVPEPAPNDAEAIEAAQYASAVQSFPLLDFIQFGRYWIELAAGGNGSWTRGEDFAELLSHSPYHDVVRKLYRTAGLDLKADLETLDAGAAIGADPDAIASLEETSVPTGNLASSRAHAAHDRRPAGPRPARRRLRGRRSPCRGQQLAAAGICRPLGPLQLYAGRVGGGSRGAPASGRHGALGLRRAAADAAGVGERPRPRRRSVRAVSTAGLVRRQRLVRPRSEWALTSS